MDARADREPPATPPLDPAKIEPIACNCGTSWLDQASKDRHVASKHGGIEPSIKAAPPPDPGLPRTVAECRERGLLDDLGLSQKFRQTLEAA